MATYVSELRAIAQWCNFGKSLENMLRDRLRALELTQSLEAAARNTKEILAEQEVARIIHEQNQLAG